MRRDPQDPAFKKILPMPVHEFRETTPLDRLEIPEVAKNRKCTDFAFFIIFTIFCIGLVGMTISLSLNTECRNYWEKYDFCGNVCGVKNIRISTDNDTCEPKDYTDYPILLITEENRPQCIKNEECKSDNSELIWERCFPKTLPQSSKAGLKKFHFKIAEDAQRSRFVLVGMVLLAFVLCLLLYALFRCNARITMIVFITSALVFSTATTVGSWTLYFLKREYAFLVPAIISLLYLVAILTLLLFVCNYFSVLTRLYKEATRMIFTAPIVLIQPLVTILFLFAVNVLLIYILLLLFSKDENDDFIFEPTIRTVNIVFICIVVYWLFAFANGCQCMIISGVIAAYYFTRDKSSLRVPYLKSLWITVHYHLGTVATGSLIITFLRILKPLSKRVDSRHSNCCLRTIGTCFEWLREMSEYFTKKAYITTALHGRGIYKSGRRSVRLLWLFLCDMIVIDDLGCALMHAASCLFMFSGLLFGLSFLLALNIKYIFVPLLFGVYLTGTVTFFYISVMNVTIETLFICFCEDRLLNTGSRYNPFYMTPELFSLMIDALELAYKESVPAAGTSSAH